METNVVPKIKGVPGPYRIFFVSFDCAEPPHVHVIRENRETKLWLKTGEVAYNHGFSRVELRKIRRLILSHRPQISEAWNEHCHPN